MFRRLFNLEATLFREQLDELRNCVEDAEVQITETARDLLAISRQTYSRGVWNFRSPV